jgi:hypothetical protein
MLLQRESRDQGRWSMVAEIVDTFGRGGCSVVQETQVAMNGSESQVLVPDSIVVPCFFLKARIMSLLQ